MTDPTKTTEGQLLLNARAAAAALSICERMLWQLTKEGRIHCTRIGRRVLYDRRDLVAFIDAQKGGE